MVVIWQHILLAATIEATLTLASPATPPGLNSWGAEEQIGQIRVGYVSLCGFKFRTIEGMLNALGSVLTNWGVLH